MLKRLDDIASGKAVATDTDLHFYSHELREKELLESYLDEGLSFDEAFDKSHLQAAEEFGTSPSGSDFYAPEANEAFEKQLWNDTK